MNKKVLILGGHGRLARALLATQPSSVLVRAVSRSELDITNRQRFEQFIQIFEPQVVINAAAWTDVTGAQQQRATVFDVNAVAPIRIAKILAKRQIPFVHYSTDYVFSGEGVEPWYEDSETSPKANGVYGQSKLEGERGLQESGVCGVVIRAGWLHSGERDFVTTILNAALAQKALKVTTSQVGMPTHTATLANWTWQLLPCIEEQTSISVMHYVESGQWITRAEFANYLLYSAEIYCTNQRFTSMANAFHKARLGLTVTQDIDDIRPANCRLATRDPCRLAMLPHWKRGVDKSVENVIKSKVHM